jgi:citrate lyase subunit beta/citryl-CoA lyase
MSLRPRRSVLYMPGSNARAIEKARTLPVDAVILDLEDSVAPEAKSSAREQVLAALNAGGFGTREIILRINGLDTPWWLEDINVAAKARPDAILVPKVSHRKIWRTSPSGWSTSAPTTASGCGP